MKKYRVWAEIDLSVLKRNIHSIKKTIPSETGIIAVVKADAYGHGALPVAGAALEAGAAMLAVGDSNEALELRNNGILAPILILGALIEEEIGWVVSYDIIPTLHGPDLIPLIEGEAARQKKRVRVHVKVDTGMTRLGAYPDLAVETVSRVADSRWLRLHGICTHLSSTTEDDPSFTINQLSIFKETIDRMRPGLPDDVAIHAANSGGIVNYPDATFTHVRPGIMMYGIDPSGEKENLRRLGLEPVLSLHSQVCFLKGVRKNTPIGYGRTFTIRENTMLAVIPIGYNDGYPYSLSNRGEVLIRGGRVPLTGTVTMDYTTVDVGGLGHVDVGDEVVLIGRQGDEEITVGELARLAATIPYEIPCRLGKRVRRVYV